MSAPTTILCLECKFFNEDDYEKFSCEAFPDGIPDEIIENKIQHNKAYKGDNGLRFAKKDK